MEFMVRSNVLTFGDFITKSGRKTPFFINTGNYKNGEQIAKLGEFYADSIVKQIGAEFDILYGPAYKGIPLCVSASIALYQKYNISKCFCFNRKESKDHGEGGILIGCRPDDNSRILIIEDVVTAGTSVRESIQLLKSIADVSLKALVVSVDRMEKGAGSKTALQEVKDEFGMEAYAIVTLQDIVEYLYNRPIDGKVVLNDEIREKISAYSRQYGAIRI
jgi:orotate phosphoribosyltransferase